MKKLLLLILSAVMLTMCLTACGDNSSTADSSSSSTADSGSSSEQDNTEMLKTANENAKLAFNTANNYIWDLVAEGQPVDPLEYTGPVDKIPDDNAVGKEVKAALKKEGIENGYISISIDKKGDEDPSNYTQWSETKDSSLVGQYPDPPKTVDKALDITLGKKA